jgi:3-(3-hydroxy-phenyl)propionate hydroxylase
VANLSWKLGAVLRGEASDALLDSYGQERKGHVTELTTRIKNIGKIVGERDEARARLRDAELLKAAGGVIRPTPRQDVQPALSSGLLAPEVHLARGTLFPQPWLKVGEGNIQRMDDVLGTGWRLILADHAGIDSQLALSDCAVSGFKAAQLGTPALTETEGVLAGWFERHAVISAIIRPDHYVYGVAKNAEELAGQLARLTLHSSHYNEESS